MKFSVIIPAYNASKTIGKTLESVYNQTFKDFECVVIADSCTDGTAAIAESFGAIVIKTNVRNEGLGRNIGLDNTSGEWVLFIDADDWWLHEFVLEQLDRKLKEIPETDILCFSFIFKGWKYAAPKGNKGHRWIAVWNKCWRREFLGDTRFPGMPRISDVFF